MIFNKLVYTVLFILFFISCAGSSSNDYHSGLKIENNYCSDEELDRRESPCRLFTSPADWQLQYPSGTEEGGMLWNVLSDGFKNKYFSLYKNTEGREYIRFSLDASDKGKSKNGSSVRAEVRHLKEWNMTTTNILSYTFYVTSTDFARAKFTVGQFLQQCDLKDSPLCRIELENGTITAKVRNYMKDGKTTSDNNKTHKYAMGGIKQGQEVSITIEQDKKTLRLYRDGKIMATHTFDAAVESEYENYFKVGAYYQNKDSPKIFSEVFVRNLSLQVGL